MFPNVVTHLYRLTHTARRGGALVGCCTEHNTPIPNREPFYFYPARASRSFYYYTHTHTRRHHHACFVCIYLIFHAHAHIHLERSPYLYRRFEQQNQSGRTKYIIIIIIIMFVCWLCWIRTHKSCSLLYRYLSIYKYIVRNSILVLSYFPRNAFQLCANKILYEIKTFFIIANCD